MITLKHRLTLCIEWQSIYRDIVEKVDMMAKAVRLSAAKDEELGERLEGEMRFEDDYSNFIRREMTTALSFIQLELNKWIWDSGHLATARIIKEATIYIVAHTPKSFDLALRNPLARLMEAYLVNRTLMVWCTIYHKNDVKLYADLAAEAMNGIKRIKNSRIRYFGKAQDVKVIVGDSVIPVGEIELSTYEKTIKGGDRFILDAFVYPVSATDQTVAWECSDDLMLSVTPANNDRKNSVVVESEEFGMGDPPTYRYGTATVTAVSSSGVKAVCTVTVEP